jgi:hypothetical protein
MPLSPDLNISSCTTYQVAVARAEVAFLQRLSNCEPREDGGEVMILSLGKVADVQSQESASPWETVNSHDLDDLVAA